MRVVLLLSVVMWQAMAASPPYSFDPMQFETFAKHVFKAIAEDVTENLIFSPISVFASLSLAALGARGETEQKLRTSLALPSDNIALKDVLLSMVDKFIQYEESPKLGVANKIFLANRFHLKAEFLEAARMQFHSQVQSLNFAESVEASKTINDWYTDQTSHRFKDLIKPDDLSGDTTLVLVNAVYFKPDWASRFDAALTKPLPFHVDATTVKDVPTMFRSGFYRYGELPEVKAKFVEIPLKNNGGTSMLIILPDEITGLAALEKDLEKITVHQLLCGGESIVNVYLPKFRIESEIQFEKPLSKLGLGDIFKNSVNFSGMVENPPLKVTKFIQKAFIEVNEDGSEASTLSRISQSYSAPIKHDFRADHPFIFMIIKRFRDSDYGRILYLGHYNV